jgi:hypothetical protein
MQELIAIAGKTSVDRVGIQKLRKEIDKSGYAINKLIATAEKQADGKALAALVTAAAVDGPLDNQLVQRVLPLLPEIGLMPLLVAHCDGDRFNMLLRVVASGRLSNERTAMALLFAVELLDDEDPPSELLTQLRLITRHNLGMEAGSLIGLTAQMLDDPDLNKVAESWIQLAKTVFPSGSHFVLSLDEFEEKPLLDALPEIIQPEPIHGYTVRRSVKKVGRNDPCPCGSGNKYKKCCAEKDKERLADPSPVAGVTMSEYKDKAHKYMDGTEIGNLRPQELAALDFEEFSGHQLVAAMRVFADYHDWENAEKIMLLLESRQDLPCNSLADEYRYELICDAASAKASNIVLRQFDRILDPAMKDELRLKAELLSPSAKTLALMEEIARKGLADPKEVMLIELSYSLLENFPALGLLIARGSLTVDRLLDSSMLIEQIEEARDVLLLPPGDPSADYFDYLLDQEADRRIETAINESKEKEFTDLVETTRILKEKLVEKTQHTNSLERELAEQQKLLEIERHTNVSQARSESKPTHMQSNNKSDEERVSQIYRLKSQVTQLKGEISEEKRERRDLRKELSKTTAQLESVLANVKTNINQSEEPDPKTEEDTLPYVRLLVPEFSEVFKETIQKIPTNIVASAIQLTSAICTGKTTKAAKVARVKSVIDLWSARVGIHYRLLFRLLTDRDCLEVVALIHRSDLEKAIKKYLS